MAISNNDPLLDDLRACETAVWDALCTGNSAADEQLLHPNFLGVYPDGFAGKADHVAQLDQGASVAAYRLGDFRVIQFGHDHALLSYRASFQRVGAASSQTMFVSSVWKRQGRSWINLFSQDTPALSDALSG